MQFLQAPLVFGSFKVLTRRIGGSVTAQCLRSYGAGPDACKGTAGIYLAFVY